MSRYCALLRLANLQPDSVERTSLADCLTRCSTLDSINALIELSVGEKNSLRGACTREASPCQSVPIGAII